MHGESNTAAMPLFFDTPAQLFDSGLQYDLGPVVPLPTLPNHRKTVNKLKLELQKKNVLEKLSLGTAHINAMTNNADFPQATRSPDDAAVQTAQTDLQTADAAVTDAENLWKLRIQERDTKEAIWDTVITARASNCEAVALGDVVKLASTGFPLRATPAPIGALPAPGNLRAEMSDMPGSIDLVWESVTGALVYRLQCMEHGSAAGWADVKTQSQVSCTVPGLVSGKIYAFRVLALGPKGEGPWSDEAVKMAP